MADLKASREDSKDHFDVVTKAVNYLLVANGAGLVGSLSVIKDYATTPQLKGLGIFIALFGIGLIGSIIFYVSVVYLQLVTIRLPEPVTKSLYRTMKAVTVGGIVGVAVAVLALLSAIGLIIVRFSLL